MERKIISKESLSDLFAKNEIEAATLLRDALMDVKKSTGEITDPHIKKYNKIENAEFLFNISLTTIKKYSEIYDYSIFNEKDEKCVVKQFSVSHYAQIKENLDKNKGDKAMNSTKSTQELLAIAFATKDFSQQKLLSIRASTKEQIRLEALVAAYPMFSKQFLLSLVISLGMDALGFYPEENNSALSKSEQI